MFNEAIYPMHTHSSFHQNTRLLYLAVITMTSVEVQGTHQGTVLQDPHLEILSRSNGSREYLQSGPGGGYMLHLCASINFHVRFNGTYI